MCLPCIPCFCPPGCSLESCHCRRRDHYGDTPLVQSAEVTNRTWTDVLQLTPALEGQRVLVRGRVHTVRGKGKSAFIVLRQQTGTVQGALFVDDVAVSKGMVKYVVAIPRESIVDVEGTVTCPERPIEACSQAGVELQVTAVRCVSRAQPLPFEVTDAARSAAQVEAAAVGGQQLVTVNQDTRLDNRFIDLRTPANQAIFRVQSTVCQLFREALLSEGFLEIHTPKLLSGASEGGAAVFNFDYMGRPGCLAQSPQFYKQMAICSDFNRVFEIGPVFRAENSFTHRHLCEFTGLDMEMAIHETYQEVLDVLDKLFVYMFEVRGGQPEWAALRWLAAWAAVLGGLQPGHPRCVAAWEPVGLVAAWRACKQCGMWCVSMCQ